MKQKFLVQIEIDSPEPGEERYQPGAASFGLKMALRHLQESFDKSRLADVLDKLISVSFSSAENVTMQITELDVTTELEPTT